MRGKSPRGRQLRSCDRFLLPRDGQKMGDESGLGDERVPGGKSHSQDLFLPRHLPNSESRLDLCCSQNPGAARRS